MSELKYLLRKKSDNSVLINRENVSTDLLQKNLTFLANSKYWHAFIVHNVRYPNKNEILKIVLDYIYPLDLIPVHFQSIGTVCMFLARNCADAILKLCKDGLLIPNPTKDTHLYTCEIVLQYATVATLKHDVQKNVSTVLNSLFNEETKTLNLELFSSNSELTEYSPLSQPKILYFVLHLSKKLNPTCIKLNNNEIRSLFPLDALSGETAVKELDLRNNLIDNISELESLKMLDLVELWLDGNPLCDNYEEHTYITTIRAILPLLEKLDGVQLKKQGEMIFEKNYLCSQDGFNLVSQFIELFFPIYDSDRKLLEELYHPNAIFSVTSIFKKGVVSSGTAKLDVYEAIGRNLLTLSNFNQNREMLIRGNVEIIKKLIGLPKTDHDTYSFCVDLVYYTNTLAAVSLTGTFREMPEGPLDPERLLGFNRMFVIRRAGDRYYIHNDLLHVHNALNHQLTNAFTQGGGMKVALVASTAKDKEKAEEAILLVTGMNREWSKRLLEDAGYDLPRLLRTIMELMKSHKIPEEAFKTSKGRDKDAFLKWMVTQALKFGVQNFRTPLREEILEYLAEHPSLLLTSEVSPSEWPASSPTEVDKDPNKLEEELWLQKYENLTSSVKKKQSDFLNQNSSKTISDIKIASGNNERSIAKDDHTILNNLHITHARISSRNVEDESEQPRPPLTTYDCVPMELSDDEETNKEPDIGQSTGFANPSLLYKGEMMPHQQNQHQTAPTDMMVHYGLNNLQLEQTVSSSLYVPYEHATFNIHPNSNLIVMGSNMQPPLNLNNMVPPIAPANVFIPPLPQEENLLKPKKHSDKIEEILRLEELKKKKVMQINLLFNKFKAQQAARAAAPPTKETLEYGHGVIPPMSGNLKSSTVGYNMNVSSPAIAPEVEKLPLMPPLMHVPALPAIYGTVTATNNEIKNSPNTDSKKSRFEKNVRTNLIDVSKIQSATNKTDEAIQRQIPESAASLNKNPKTISIKGTVSDRRCSRTERKNSSGTSEKKSHSTAAEQEKTTRSIKMNSCAPRAPSIILINDDTIPSSVNLSNKTTDKELKQLNWRPPTITLLDGKWTYIEQNEEQAFRIVYGKWILMRKDESGKWHPVEDDFVKTYSCGQNHFPTNRNEKVHHTLSLSCTTSFDRTKFDAIPDPVTYWDFPASVPHDLRPPQSKELKVKGNTHHQSITPGSGFGFISVHAKWVLLAQNEHNQWVIMRKKGIYIAWLDGKWTCNAFPRIVIPALRIFDDTYMPTLGLFSKKWITIPNDTMTLKLLFGYWVVCRRGGRLNVARDDFANAFICKKKHFPGDRESMPSPREGRWRKPPNFHTAQLSCLPSFDSKIFDSIAFPVTSYHFLPTVPKELRPPKRYMILDPEIRRYVEKDIIPESRYGFVSVNGKWEIRKKTRDGTWMPVEKCPETKKQSETGTENEEVLNSSLISLSADTSMEVDAGKNTASSASENKPVSIIRYDNFKNPKLATSSEIHHVQDTTKKVGGITIYGEDETRPIEESRSSEKSKNDPDLKTQPVTSGDKGRSNSFKMQTPKNVDDIPKSREGKQQLTEEQTPSAVCKSTLNFKKVRNNSRNEEIVESHEKHNVGVAQKEVDGTISPQDGKLLPIEEKSSFEANKIETVEKIPSEAGNQPDRNENSSNLLTTQMMSKQTDRTVSSSKDPKVKFDIYPPNDAEDQHIQSKVDSSNLASPTTQNTHQFLMEATIVSDDKNIFGRTLENKTISPTSRGIPGKGTKENDSTLSSSYTANVKSVKIDKTKDSGDYKTRIRLKTLNQWKKAFQLIPSVPKLTLLNGEWEIISDNPQLKFHQFGSGIWQLHELTSTGEWKPLNDDFALAKERSRNPNNLEEYITFIGNNKFDSIPIPVTHSDFPSSVYNNLRPPLVMKYEKEIIQIEVNSGYACLSIEGNWILIKQDDMGTWSSVEDEYKVAVREKLNNIPGKYLSNPITSRKSILSSSNLTDSLQKLSTAVCPFAELITGNIPEIISKALTHWDINVPEEQRPPKFALTEVGGKRQWSGIRPNSGLGFVREDNVWVLMKQTEFNEWNECKISCYEGWILGYFLMNNRWIIMKKYILGGKWEPLFDHKSTPSTYWDFTGPEEEKPPRNIFLGSQKKSISIHKNSGMGFLRKEDIWYLMEEKNGEWSAVIDGEYECIYKLIDGMWVAVFKKPDGKWTPVPVACPKLITHWNFNGLPDYAPPQRIVFEENGTKSSKLINEESGLGFILDEGVWVLAKEGENGEFIHVSNLEKDTGKIGFESRNGKSKMIKKDEAGKWIRSKDISENPSNISKRQNSLREFSFDDKFSQPTPITYFDITPHIPEHLKPPKCAFIPSVNCHLKFECIRSNSGYGFVFRNDIWCLMRWIFGRGWVSLEELMKINILGYKAIEGRWVPMKKEEDKLVSLFDPFSTPIVVGQCFGSKDNQPPSRVPVDGINIVNVTFESKMGFVKDSGVWILMAQQEDDTWKRFAYSKDSEGIYGYKRNQDNFILVKKCVDGQWLRVYWDWNTNMWVFVFPKQPREMYNHQTSECTKQFMDKNLIEAHKSLKAIFTTDEIIQNKTIDTSKSYIESSQVNLYDETNTSVQEDSKAPSHIESGINGSLECIKITQSNCVSFVKRNNVWIMVAKDFKGWFIPNDSQGYQLIDHRWVLMKQYASGSWLPIFDPMSTPRYFWDTISIKGPKRVAVYIDGIAKWMDTAFDLNLGFIKDDVTWILVKKRDVYWEVMTDDSEESSTLAFKLINYRWKRVKKSELGEWIPCSEQISLPVLPTDIVGTDEVSPPRGFHLINKEGKLTYVSNDSIDNVGFEQQDLVWVVMQCNKDYTWSRLPGVYNEEGVYGYQYINFIYTLMKNENGSWVVEENAKKEANGTHIEASSQEIRKQNRIDGAKEIIGIDIESGNNLDATKLTDNDIPTNARAKQRVLLNPTEMPISAFDACSVLPEYLKPPRFITVVENEKLQCVKISKDYGKAFIKRHDIWLYVNRDSDGWFVVNVDEGYKLMDNRWVLIKKGPDGTWLPSFDPITTPRTARDTVGIQNQPPERVVVCKNKSVTWMNTCTDPSLGFVKDNCAWILKKKENDHWTVVKDDMEEKSSLCFKLIDHKWQRVKKDVNSEWIPCCKQLSLPITYHDVFGPPEVRPPSTVYKLNHSGSPRRILFNLNCPYGFIQKDGVWILMQLEKNHEWSECKEIIKGDGDGTYGFKFMNNKWSMMKNENDKWIPGIITNNRWQPIEIKKKENIIVKKVAKLSSKKVSHPFKYFLQFPECQKPPESLLLIVDETTRRVWFSYENNYTFQKQDGVWILMEKDYGGHKAVQYSADRLLGHKLIDNRWVCMEKVGNSDWVCSFDPILKPRSFYDTVGPRYARPPFRIVLKEEDGYRWKIISEENGLGFVKENDIWILMYRQSDISWTKFRENSSEEEIGFKIVDFTWSKFKRSINDIWRPCASVHLPSLSCDFPIDCYVTPPLRVFYSSYMSSRKRSRKDIVPESKLGFQLEDGAWVLMECQENGTWSKVDFVREQKGTFGFARFGSKTWELLKRDGDRWRVYKTKGGRNGKLVDINDEDARAVEKADEPLAKKRRLELTCSDMEVSKNSMNQNSNSTLSTTNLECESSSTILTIKPLEENCAEIYLKNLLSSQIPMTWQEFSSQSFDKQPPNNIVINVSGTLRRIFLTTNKTEIAFLKEDGYWIAIKRYSGSWRTVHSNSDGLLGYGLVDNRWVIMKKKQKNEWIPTFDPVLTPRNHFDTVGPFESKPPMRVVVNENGIDRWKIVGEENGLGFIKQTNIWVLMIKVDASWIQVTDNSDEEIIGYQIINGKWTRVKKGKDDVWKPCSKACLPCLHWDYVCWDETTPPKSLPVYSSSSMEITTEVINVDSVKGFDKEDGAWILKECKEDGTWKRVHLLPGHRGSLGLMYRLGWKIVRKDKSGNWVEISEFSANQVSLESASLENQHFKYIHSKGTNQIKVPLSSEDCSNLSIDAPVEQITTDAQLSNISEAYQMNDMKEIISTEKPMTYHQFRNAPLEKRPPRSVLINHEGKLKRVLLTQKNENIGFQKEGDIWILMKHYNQLWKTVQNTVDGLFGFKLIDNRWVIMRKGDGWIPTFDPITTPRTFFDTVGRRDTRPPIRIALNENGVYRWQIISEENGFGFIRQGEMWILMKKQADESWIEFTDDLIGEIIGYNLMNCRWTRFKKNESDEWICYSRISLPVLHWDFVNGDHVAPPQCMCNCCDDQEKKNIDSCLGPGSGKGFQLEDGAWVAMECAEDGSWSKLDLFPDQPGAFGYMNKEGWKIVKRDMDDNWRFVTRNDDGLWVFRDLEETENEITCETNEKKRQDSEDSIVSTLMEQTSCDELSVPTSSKSESSKLKITENTADEQSCPEKYSSLSSTITTTSQVNVVTEVPPKKCEFEGISNIMKLSPPLSKTEVELPHTEEEFLQTSCDELSVPTSSKSESSKHKITENMADEQSCPEKYSSLSSTITTTSQVNVVTEVPPKKCEFDGISNIMKLSPPLSKTEVEFPHTEEEFLKEETSTIALDIGETMKQDETSENKFNFPYFENSDLDDLLPPLTPNYFHTLPNVPIEVDEKWSGSSAGPSTNSRTKMECGNEEPLSQLSLNSVEIYLAANPNYELSCPELQNLLREFRPIDKPNKLIRRKFRLPNGNHVLLTIPKGSPEASIESQISNRQELNAVEHYLATHLPSEWASPELKRILCQFQANDLKVSKRPCNYEFLFPDGQRRALTVPRKTDVKNNAMKVLSAEIKNILKSYEKCCKEEVGVKRKFIENDEVPTKIERIKRSKRIQTKKICEYEVIKECSPRKGGLKKPGSKSKTHRN